MSYIAKIQYRSGNISRISVVAGSKEEATSIICDLHPHGELISIEPGRCHPRPTFVK